MNDIKFKIIENIDDEDLMSIFDDDTAVYVKPGVFAMSERKLESLVNIARIQKYYQCNPVRFIDDFFNIELLDAQAYVVQRTWNCPNVLVLASRGFGKSTVIDLILMSKDMLFCNVWSYIASGSGSQAEETFKKALYVEKKCGEVSMAYILTQILYLSQLHVGSTHKMRLPITTGYADKICKNRDFVPEGKMDDRLFFL